jgi:hypothetical protein
MPWLREAEKLSELIQGWLCFAPQPITKKHEVLEMSMTKGQRRYTKREMGYEENPARCGSCVHYLPKQHREHIATSGEKFLVILAARCTAGDFFVQPSSLCDHWVGKRGETLQPETKNGTA